MNGYELGALLAALALLAAVTLGTRIVVDLLLDRRRDRRDRAAHAFLSGRWWS